MTRALRFAAAAATLGPLLAHLARYGPDAGVLVAVAYLAGFGLAVSRARAGLPVAAALTFAVPLLPVVFEVFPFAIERVLLLGALAGRLARPEPLFTRDADSDGWAGWVRLLFCVAAATTVASGLASFVRELPAGAGWAWPAWSAWTGDLLAPRPPLDPTHGLSVGWLRLEGLALAWLVFEDARADRALLRSFTRAVAVVLVLGLVVGTLEVWRGLVFRGQPLRVWLGGSFPRSHRPLTDHNALGSALVLLIPITAAVLLTPGARRGLGAAAWIALPAALFGLVTSRSKAAFAALAVALLVLALLAFGFARRGRRALGIGLVVLGLGFGVGIQLLPDSAFEPLRGSKHGQDLVRALRLEAATDYLSEYRASPWSGARSMIRTHPWLGVGLGRFPRELKEHRDPTLEVPFAPDHENAHSQPLQWAAELGLAGVLLESLLLAGAVLGALRASGRAGEHRQLAAGLAAGLVGLTLNLTVGHSLLETVPAYLFAVASGLGLALFVGLAGPRGGPPLGFGALPAIAFVLYLWPAFTADRRERAEASLGAYSWIDHGDASAGRDRMVAPRSRWFTPFERGARLVLPVRDPRPGPLRGTRRARLALDDGPFGPWVELPHGDLPRGLSSTTYLKAPRPPGVADGDLVELRLEVEPATATTLWFDAGRNPLGARVSRPGFAP